MFFQKNSSAFNALLPLLLLSDQGQDLNDKSCIFKNCVLVTASPVALWNELTVNRSGIVPPQIKTPTDWRR